MYCVVSEAVLSSAYEALFVLTKARCAKGLQVTRNTRYKVLYSWPVHLDRNPEVLAYLENLGRGPTKQGVAGYPVEYQRYEALTKVDTPLLQQLEEWRSYIVGCLIQFYFLHEDLEVTAFWDQQRHPDVIAPSSTSDWCALETFSARKDAMYGFSSPHKQFNFKLPAHAGEKLFQACDSLQGKRLQQRDYLGSSGKRTDSKGRANRYVVLPGKRAELERVQADTLASLRMIREQIDFEFL